MKYLPAIVIAVVAAAVVAGLILVGSPRNARRQRFDERRVNDLSNIQYQIFYQWEQKGAVPQTLAELTSSGVGFQAPADPETQLPYEYQKVSADSYTICADFALDSPEKLNSTYPAPTYYKDPYYLGQFDWSHGQGRSCFTRTIDRSQYQKDHPQNVR